uniref:Fe2OG dioxygenase domain-containing protein n=1 Tax=Periophthalmus magnuspinnatus TaxID=409849 RepID=A0A3B4BE22_9GOBI
MDAIPVLDFGVYSLECDPESVSETELKRLSQKIYEAFTRVGFVFLKNTGITHEEVRKGILVRNIWGCNVFSGYDCGNHGWVSMETERLNPARPGDLKESFNTTLLSPDILWPTGGTLSDFREVHTSFFHRCTALGLRVLRLLALSLHLPPETFVKDHSKIGELENCTTLRSNFYPPIDAGQAKPGQLRCGEHSDYGSITLLFQSSPGIQVRSVSGEFISAPCLPGAVLVNIADLMQRWTSDTFISAVHRVQLPPPGDSSQRQSLAFFMQPDDSAVISCCDGSNKYPPIRSDQYIHQRFEDSYGRK